MVQYLKFIRNNSLLNGLNPELLYEYVIEYDIKINFDGLSFKLRAG